MALWMDYREFNGKSSLSEATDEFIVINNQLHEDFDDFKALETTSESSYLNLIELLEYYCTAECPSLLESNRIKKFGKTYLVLSREQVDMLVEWVLKMRQMYTSNSEVIFARAGALIQATTSNAGFHLGGGGGVHSPPLGMHLPPLGNHTKIPLTDKNM